MQRAKKAIDASKAAAKPAGMTAEELPFEARIRLEHAERFIAWTEDFTGIVAVGDSYESVREAVRLAGAARSVIEWVPPVPVRPLDRGI